MKCGTKITPCGDAAWGWARSEHAPERRNFPQRRRGTEIFRNREFPRMSANFTEGRSSRLPSKISPNVPLSFLPPSAFRRPSDYEYRGKRKVLTTENTEKHGICHLAKIRGNVEEKRHSCRFAEICLKVCSRERREFRSSFERYSTVVQFLLFMRLRRRFPLGIRNRGRIRTKIQRKPKTNPHNEKFKIPPHLPPRRRDDERDRICGHAHDAERDDLEH